MLHERGCFLAIECGRIAIAACNRSPSGMEGTLPYAPDLEGAWLTGAGVHAYVTPEGRFMDHIWFYDRNAHRWIAIYAGLEVATFGTALMTGAAYSFITRHQSMGSAGAASCWRGGSERRLLRSRVERDIHLHGER